MTRPEPPTPSRMQGSSTPSPLNEHRGAASGRPAPLPPFGPPSGGPFLRQELAVPIPDHASRNFQTLLLAARNDDLALMECLDAETRELRYDLCAVGRDGEDYVRSDELRGGKEGVRTWRSRGGTARLRKKPVLSLLMSHFL